MLTSNDKVLDMKQMYLQQIVVVSHECRQCLLHKGDSTKVDNDAITLMEKANVKTKWLCDMMKHRAS